MKVLAPSRTPQGLVQFRQYLTWAATVVDLSPVLLHVSSTTSSAAAAHVHNNTTSSLLPWDPSDSVAKQMQSARSICDRLRDGAILFQLVTAALESVGASPPLIPPSPSPSPSSLSGPKRSTTPVGGAKRQPQQQQPPPRASSPRAGRKTPMAAGGPQLAAVTLHAVVEALKHLLAVTHEADLCVLPRMEELYSGSLEAVGTALMVCFHCSVVKERLSLLPTMMAWYATVARLYRLPVPKLSVAVEDLHSVFDDGLLWVLGLHNVLKDDVIVDLGSVYRRPINLAQREANISFAMCLFELRDIFCYYHTVEEMVQYGNHHFTLMQAFAVFQDAAGGGNALQPVDLTTLRFALTDPMGLRGQAPQAEEEVEEEHHPHHSPDAHRHSHRQDDARAEKPRMAPGTGRTGKEKKHENLCAADQVVKRSAHRGGRPAAEIVELSSDDEETPLCPPPSRIGGGGGSIGGAIITHYPHRTPPSSSPPPPPPETSSSSVVASSSSVATAGVAVSSCRVAVAVSGTTRLEPFYVCKRGAAIELSPLPSTSSSTPAPQPPPQHKPQPRVVYRIPLAVIDRVRLCQDQSSVVLECNKRAPTAPPPYDASCAPAVTLFFASATNAAEFLQTVG